MKATGAADSRAFPFCSVRCRYADLDRWFTEEYRVPGGALPGEAGEDLVDQ